jgi:hypothetical protein
VSRVYLYAPGIAVIQFTVYAFGSDDLFERRFARDNPLMRALPAVGFPLELDMLLLGQQDHLLGEWRAPLPLSDGPVR